MPAAQPPDVFAGLDQLLSVQPFEADVVGDWLGDDAQPPERLARLDVASHEVAPWLPPGGFGLRVERLASQPGGEATLLDVGGVDIAHLQMERLTLVGREEAISLLL